MSLNWEELDLNQIRAKNDPYEFVIWSPDNTDSPSELRVIRKDNAGGIIVPIQDFSVFAGSKQDAITLAETMNNALSQVSDFNDFSPLFD